MSRMLYELKHLTFVYSEGGLLEMVNKINSLIALVKNDIACMLGICYFMKRGIQGKDYVVMFLLLLWSAAGK